MQRIVDEVEKKKNEYRRGAADRAREALEDLRKHDPAGFATVLTEFRRSGSTAATTLLDLRRDADRVVCVRQPRW